MKPINPRSIPTARPGRHRVAGTPGLYVIVRPSGSKSWQFRGWNGHKEIQRGLGHVLDVPLQAARDAAVSLRAGIIAGVADLPRSSSRRGVQPSRTWQMAFDHLVETREIKPATLASYRSTWRVHVEPRIGNRDVSRTTREEIVTLIKDANGSGGNKTRKLLSMVGDCAVSMGWVTVHPADRAILAALPVAARTATEGRRRSMPHAEIPAYLDALPENAAGDVIRMLVQTATRLNDVLGARWDEIDADGKTWTVPGARHKSGRDFIIPLTDATWAILERRRGASETFVFPSLYGGITRPISGTTVRRLMVPEYDLHGFRASFRTWAAETEQDRETAETALSHAVGSSVERCYQRSDLLERRRRLMASWSTFVGSKT